MSDEPTFLNLDLAAPAIRRMLDGVTIEAGTIALARVHGDAEQLDGELEVAAALGGVAGIGAAPNGDVYLTDTDGDRILRIAACGAAAEQVGCLRVKGPRGVLVGPREALYVADTGHHRILVVDLATEQVRTTWGQRDPYADPVPGAAPGELDSPWDLAADAQDRLYVVDHGNRRIQRFDAGGMVDAAFADALEAAATVPTAPEYIVTALLAGEEHLLVFDRLLAGRSRLLVYDLDGAFRADATRDLRSLLVDSADALFGLPPSAIAAAGAMLYVAEAATGRVLEFDLAGHFVGIVGWNGVVAGLALDAQGRLLVNPRSGSPVGLAAGRLAETGTFRVGPIAVSQAGDRVTAWQTLHARLDPLPDGAHLRLFALSTDAPGQAPPDLDAAAWSASPLDAATWLMDVDPAPFLWIGGRLTSSAAGGPVVRALRVEFDRDGWLRYLPAIYGRESSDFLEPALALLEDALAEQEAHIDGLPALFDPQAAPADALDWLAGWLAWDLEETLGERERRALIGRAFDLQGRRGTAGSLRELVRIVLGADAAVSEPAASLRVWQLGEETAQLGRGTMLFAAEPDGAVVGTTAELDRSHLLPAEDYGAPVFASTASRFCVRVYAADLAAPGARDMLERLVERERPAGTEAHVCIVEPRLRVGFQASVGVDAIVGCEPEPLRLGDRGLLGAGAVLAAAGPPRTVGRVRAGLGETSTRRGAT